MLPLPTSLTGTAVVFLARPHFGTRYIRPSPLLASDAPPRRQFDTVIDTFAAAPFVWTTARSSDEHSVSVVDTFMTTLLL
jgi:hypothetical protein